MDQNNIKVCICYLNIYISKSQKSERNTTPFLLSCTFAFFSTHTRLSGSSRLTGCALKNSIATRRHASFVLADCPCLSPCSLMISFYCCFSTAQFRRHPLALHEWGVGSPAHTHTPCPSPGFPELWNSDWISTLCFLLTGICSPAEPVSELWLRFPCLHRFFFCLQLTVIWLVSGIADWCLWGRKDSDTTERLNWTELNCDLTSNSPLTLFLSSQWTSP